MCIWRSMLKIRQPQSLLPQKQAFIFTLLGLHVDCSLTIKSWAWLDGFGPDCGLGSGLLYVSPFGPQDEWASTPRAVWDSTKFVMHACVRSHFSCCKLFVILWTVACQASLSMGFSRLEYWSGLPDPSPGDLPNPGIKPASLISPALAGGFFITNVTWEAPEIYYGMFQTSKIRVFFFFSLPPDTTLAQDSTIPGQLPQLLNDLLICFLTFLPAVQHISHTAATLYAKKVKVSRDD